MIVTAVIDRSSQINVTLKQESDQLTKIRHSPLPNYKYEFWEKFIICIHDIYDQLINNEVKKMKLILESTHSPHANALKETFKRVVRGMLIDECYFSFSNVISDTYMNNCNSFHL
ncbi:unnamed protein product [Heterobilharzia americana]|nr:unnamed protein product [Heterobilharzia americana]